MDKYVEAEERLAGLLGQQPDAFGNHIGAHWTRDNAAAFSLMVEHDVRSTSLCDIYAYADIIDDDGNILADVMVLRSAHTTKKAAVRYAIVMAVIAKLEAQNA